MNMHDSVIREGHLSLCLGLAVFGPVVCGLVLALLLAFRRSTERWEKPVAAAAQVALFISLLVLVFLTGHWIWSGRAPVDVPINPGLATHDHEHGPSVWRLDGSALLIGLLSSSMALGSMRFASTYLHREPSFSRFFMVGSLFAGSMLGLIFSGTLALTAFWWEIIGFCSVLLIGFYHSRPGPQAGARTVFAFYRVADTGLLLAVTWPLVRADDTSFAALDQLEPTDSTIVGFFLLLAAAGKSAQWPLMRWLPRAMEGPTPSSALFYGGMSVHAGAYLLLRTSEGWLDSTPVQVAIGVIGGITLLSGLARARLRADAKGSLANSTSASLGLVLVIASLGWIGLATWMLAGNAAMRWYQMLRVPALAQEMARRRRQGHGYSPPPLKRGQDMIFLLGSIFRHPNAWLATLWASLEKAARVWSPGLGPMVITRAAPLVAFVIYWVGQASHTNSSMALLALVAAWTLVTFPGLTLIGRASSGTWRAFLAAGGMAITLFIASMVPGDHTTATRWLVIAGVIIGLAGALETLGSRVLPDALVAAIHGWTGVGMAACAHRPGAGIELVFTLVPVTVAAAWLMGAVKARLGQGAFHRLGGLGIEAPRLEAAWLLVGAALVGTPPWITFSASDWTVEEGFSIHFVWALTGALLLALLTIGWMRALLDTLWGPPAGLVEEGPVPDLLVLDWVGMIALMALAALLPVLVWN
ncbi:MAG: proton-conducting transporter membrane subunit [Gemmataceae bacterium]